jgi:hypothetical protein
MGNETGRTELADAGRSHKFVLARTKIRLTFLRTSDDTPVSGLVVRLGLPDGEERELTADAKGVVEAEFARPGQCTATSRLPGARLPTTWDFVAAEAGPLDAGATPEESGGSGSQSGATPEQSGGAQSESGASPSQSSSQSSGGAKPIVAHVEAHKVRKGESIDSLAKANGLTWQELSKFNWGTSVPDEINEHLRDEVGCTKKTADGNNYVFDDSDDPGIVFIPTVWKEESLASGQNHTVRVAAPSSPFLLRFVLESETTGHLLPFHPFVVRDGGGNEVAQGRTDASAEGIVAVPARGEYEVVPGSGTTHRVSGRVHYADGITPLCDATLEVLPWQEEARSVRSGPGGELTLEAVPLGELLLRHDGKECCTYVHGDVEGAVFFVPTPPPAKGNPYPPYEGGECSDLRIEETPEAAESALADADAPADTEDGDEIAVA